MNNLILVFKGFLIGIVKIMPGVSGGMLAIALGLYEKGIYAISHFFSNMKENLTFLGLIGIGILLAIIFGSKGISYAMTHFYLPTMLFFIGLIAGGLPIIYKKARKKPLSCSTILVFICSFILVYLFAKVSNGNNQNLTIMTFNNFLFLMFAGLLDAGTMVIPGISGTALLLLLGCYDVIIGSFANLTSLSLLSETLIILTPFFLGILIGVIIFVKLMEYLFENHEHMTYYAILGFTMSSLFLLFRETLINNYILNDIIIGLTLFVIGFQISRKLDKN